MNSALLRATPRRKVGRIKVMEPVTTTPVTLADSRWMQDSSSPLRSSVSVVSLSSARGWLIAKIWSSGKASLAAPSLFARCLATLFSMPWTALRLLWYASPPKAMVPEEKTVSKAIPVGSTGIARAAAAAVAAAAEVLRPEWVALVGIVLLEGGLGDESVLL